MTEEQARDELSALNPPHRAEVMPLPYHCHIRFQGYCESCGWFGPVRLTRTLAQDDCDRHNQDFPYDREGR